MSQIEELDAIANGFVTLIRDWLRFRGYDFRVMPSPGLLYEWRVETADGSQLIVCFRPGPQAELRKLFDLPKLLWRECFFALLDEDLLRHLKL